jgi:hypothetical protein
VLLDRDVGHGHSEEIEGHEVIAAHTVQLADDAVEDGPACAMGVAQ